MNGDNDRPDLDVEDRLNEAKTPGNQRVEDE